MKTILRFEKIKDFKHLNLSNAHVQRYMDTPNADGKVKNKKIFGSGNLVKDVKEEFSKRLSKKPRKGAVLCMEAIFSLSPKYFENKNDVKMFAKGVVEYLKENFSDNTISIVLHLDESTPHIHAHILPITDDGRLSAFEIFNKNTLREHQKKYCETMSKVIGREFTYKEGSKAKHEDVKKFYKEIEENKKEHEKLQDKLFEEQEKNIDLENKVDYLKTQVQNQSEEISRLNKLVEKLKKAFKRLKSQFSSNNNKSNDPYELPKLTIENHPDSEPNLKNRNKNKLIR